MFVDVDKLGYGTVLLVAVVFLAIFFGLGLITTALSKRLDRERRSPVPV